MTKYQAVTTGTANLVIMLLWSEQHRLGRTTLRPAPECKPRVCERLGKNIDGLGDVKSINQQDGVI
jgi:hypothetical protein